MSKKKVRIIERTLPDGVVLYVIQRKGWISGWRDAWLESGLGAACRDSFFSLKEARENLCYFDGSKAVDRVIDVGVNGHNPPPTFPKPSPPPNPPLVGCRLGICSTCGGTGKGVKD